MSNANGIDHSEIEMMTALLRFKKKHGVAAYCALLDRFNVQRWSEIPSTAHGEVMVQCKAGVAGLTIEDADDEAPRRRTTRRAARKEGRKLSAFETVVNAAPTLQDGLNMAARAIHSRPAKT